MKKQEKEQTEKPDEQYKDDSPITNLEQDSLGRYQFVRNLANALLADVKTETKSKIFALTGKWGVGKTSVMNLLEKIIGEKKKEKNYQNLYLLKFNPWSFNKKDTLIKQCLEELYVAVEGENGKIKKVRKAIATYYKRFDTNSIKTNISDLIASLIAFVGVLVSSAETKNASVIIIPVEMNAAFLPAKQQGIMVLYLLPVCFFLILLIISLVRFVKTLISSKVIFSKKTLQDQKTDVSNSIKENNIHLIILIDDIDRLTPKETLQLFRIVRSNADFENTTYLLSFDKNIIIKNLQNEQIEGENFLEKIITTEYMLHAPENFRIREYLNKELNALLNTDQKWIEDVKEDSYKFGQILYLISQSLITMRDIKRYLNSLTLHSKNLINEGIAEVNFIDLLIVECLMLKYRDTYYGIMNNKNYILNTSQDSIENELKYITDKKEFARKDEECRRSVNEYIKEFCKTELELKMLMWLFPNLYFAFEKELSLSLLNYRPNQVVRNNICIPNSFDFYFSSGINLDDPDNITNKELQEFSGTATAKDSMISYLKKCKESEKFELLIEILRDVSKTKSFIPLKNASYFVSAMFDVQCLISCKQRAYFTTDTRGICKEIICSYLKQYLQNSKDILLEAINQTDSLYPLLSFLSDQKQKLNVGNSGVVINKNEFEIIKTAILNKVEIKYKNNRKEFFADDDLEEIFNYWYHIDNKHFEKKTKSETGSVKKLCELMINLYKRRNNISEYYYPYRTTGCFGDLSDFKLRLEKALKNKTLDSRYRIIARYFIDNWRYRDLQIDMNADDVKKFDKEREMEEENKKENKE